MDKRAKQRLYGAVLQYMRTCTLERAGWLNWNGDSRAQKKILELEEKHLHRWVRQFTVFSTIARFVALELFFRDGEEKDSKSLEGRLGAEAVEDLASRIVDVFDELAASM